MAIDSLSMESNRKGSTKQLLTRSCLVVFAVLAVVVVVSFLPHARRSPVGKPRGGDTHDECSERAILRHLHVLHRHGERTPIHWFDFEGGWGWKKEDLAPGKLTSRGMEHGFHLGQDLKLRYYHSGSFSPKEHSVEVFSTDYDRTVDTVTSLLLGMYSRQGTATNVNHICECREGHGKRSSPACIAQCIGISSDDLPKIPDVTVMDESNPVLYQAAVCKGWDAWLEQLETSAKWTEAADGRFANVKDEMISLAGSDKVEVREWPDGACQGCANIDDPEFNSLGLMEQVWSNLECYDVDGKSYSSNSSNNYILDTLQPVADFSWQTRYNSKKGILTGGVLLDEMIKKFQDVSKQQNQCHRSRKVKDCHGDGASMTIYSAHDTTVYSLLAALGAAEKLPIPRFASHIRAELWEKTACPSNRKFEVRLFYDSNVDGAAIGDVLRESPACLGGTCSLDSFIKATRSMVLPAAECQKKQSPSYNQVLLGTDCCTSTETQSEL